VEVFANEQKQLSDHDEARSRAVAIKNRAFLRIPIVLTPYGSPLTLDYRCQLPSGYCLSVRLVSG